jgi:NADH:quinone reductase (non-electrogenic)
VAYGYARSVAQRVVILGAGFAGSYVGRYLGRGRNAVQVTLIDPRNYMLYTPLLPEAASGTVEPRHTVVPVRVMCPHARLILGRAQTVDWDAQTVAVELADGTPRTVPFDHLVVSVGSVTRTAPVPGLLDHAIGFKTLAEAINLRNHVLHQLELADVSEDDAERRRRLTFAFVGGGYAGVEALAELEDLCRDASRWYPGLKGVPRRWVLVDIAPHILPDLHGELGVYATNHLRRRGVELKLSTSLQAADDRGVTLSNGERIETATLVWTAGVRPHPLVSRLGLPTDEQGRVTVDGALRVEGMPGVWALGDSAAVPNAATPGRSDPPTCQHALRQSRALARNIKAQVAGKPLRRYRYRMLGQVATLGEHKGVAEVLGLELKGWPGWWCARSYHLYQLPLPSRKARVVAAWTVDLFFRRDIVELGSFDEAAPLARQLSERP